MAARNTPYLPTVSSSWPTKVETLSVHTTTYGVHTVQYISSSTVLVNYLELRSAASQPRNAMTIFSPAEARHSGGELNR
jgi:hypothetical protein